MAKKKGKDKYAISNKYDVVREQLGLPIYSYTEETPRTVELPVSEHPDVPFFSDIDVSQWKAYDEVISWQFLGAMQRSGIYEQT